VHGRDHSHFDGFRIQTPRLLAPWKMTRSSCSTSRAISGWIAAAAFLQRERVLDRPRLTDSFVDFEQIPD
jgi:hypothetical protein